MFQAGGPFVIVCWQPRSAMKATSKHEFTIRLRIGNILCLSWGRVEHSDRDASRSFRDGDPADPRVSLRPLPQ